jgi:hypothetical protein
MDLTHPRLSLAVSTISTSILLMKSPYISLCIMIIRESSTISQNHRLRPKTLTGNAFDLSLSGGIGSPKIWRRLKK